MKTESQRGLLSPLRSHMIDCIICFQFFPYFHIPLYMRCIFPCYIDICFGQRNTSWHNTSRSVSMCLYSLAHFLDICHLLRTYRELLLQNETEKEQTWIQPVPWKPAQLFLAEPNRLAWEQEKKGRCDSHLLYSTISAKLRLINTAEMRHNQNSNNRVHTWLELLQINLSHCSENIQFTTLWPVMLPTF